MAKPFSQACENNKVPILQIIRTVFQTRTTVWEIGSGTGQHACYFAAELPHLTWQATDKAQNLAGIDAWLAEADLPNLPKSLPFDVNDETWPAANVRALFTANTLHIMTWPEVCRLFSGLQKTLDVQADVCIYGPFNYNGRYTSASNERFDYWLKVRDPGSGIRDQAAVVELADSAGLALIADHAMPANNRLLVFRKGRSAETQSDAAGVKSTHA